MLFFNPFFTFPKSLKAYLNTSNVILQLFTKSITKIRWQNLNTSNVILQSSTKGIHGSRNLHLNTSNVILQF